MSDITLSIIKPDAVAAGNAGNIIQHFEDNGLTVAAVKKTCLTQAQAAAFYAVHRERPFYNDLVAFMTEGPLYVMILKGENAVLRNRELMGATNPAEASDGSLRQLYGTNIERNAVHGSDSDDNGKIETDFFFSTAERL